MSSIPFREAMLKVGYIRCKYCNHAIRLDVENGRWVHTAHHNSTANSFKGYIKPPSQKVRIRDCKCTTPEPAKIVPLNERKKLMHEYVVFSTEKQLKRIRPSLTLITHKADEDGNLVCTKIPGKYEKVTSPYPPQQCKICYGTAKRNRKHLKR